MNGSLEGKVALVTGGAKGIGLGCVTALAARGARVALTDKNVREGRARALEARRGGADVEFFEMDVTRWDAVVRGFRAVQRRFGRIDTLVNNAGFHDGKGLLDCSPKDWDRLLTINLRSVFFCCKAGHDALSKTKGSIVNVSSCAGLRGQRNSVAYSASKGGIIAMTKSLALDLAPQGVRVNCVCPGNIETPLMNEWIASQPNPRAVRARVRSAQPLGRIGTQQDVGEVVGFLASGQSAFVTGSCVVIDGGATLGY